VVCEFYVVFQLRNVFSCSSYGEKNGTISVHFGISEFGIGYLVARSFMGTCPLSRKFMNC